MLYFSLESWCKMKNRIRELRKSEKLTLKELSQKIGIASNTLSQYETSKREPKLDMWSKLAKYFNVPIPYLQGIGVSKYEMCDYLLDEFYSEEKIKNPIDSEDTEKIFHDELDRYLDNKTEDEIFDYIEKNDGYYPSKIGQYPYIDNLIKKDFLKNIALLNNYEYLSTIDKSDFYDDVFRLKILNKIENDRYKSQKDSKPKILFGIDMEKLVHTLFSKVFELDFKEYSKKELIKKIDDIIELLNKVKEKVSQYQDNEK